MYNLLSYKEITKLTALKSTFNLSGEHGTTSYTGHGSVWTCVLGWGLVTVSYAWLCFISISLFFNLSGGWRNRNKKLKHDAVCRKCDQELQQIKLQVIVISLPGGWWFYTLVGKLNKKQSGYPCRVKRFHTFGSGLGICNEAMLEIVSDIPRTTVLQQGTICHYISNHNKTPT